MKTASKRFWLKQVTAAAAIATLAPLALAQEAPKSVRIGWAIAKTGHNAGGTAATVMPNYQLWVKEINAAGGIMLKAYGKRVPIEVVEYDDRSSTEEAVRATERLMTQDKVDFVLPPPSTALATSAVTASRDSTCRHTSTSVEVRASATALGVKVLKRSSVSSMTKIFSATIMQVAPSSV